VGRKIRRWLLATLGLLGGLTALSAHGASPVWAIHGAHNTVYLAGSVHLLKAGESTLPSAFDRAYAGSQGLVMELDLGNLNPLEAAGWMLEHGALPEGVTLQQRLGDSRYQKVSAEAHRLGMPPELLQQQQPWVVGMELLELKYQQLGFQAEEGVEQQLQQRAQADHKPTSGLETVAEQLGVLGGMSDEDQVRFLDMILAEMGDVGGDTQQVISAWRNGDAARLASLLSEEYESFPALYRTLVSERNRHWLPQIEQLLQGRQDYFVIVGALHLVGEGGLLDLVRRAGYRPEQLN
jgi:uncharacterized protein YbaP (TraB family)